MAFSGTQTTRHGLYGGARMPYGSFAGKAESADAALAYAVLDDVASWRPLEISSFRERTTAEWRRLQMEVEIS